MEFANQAYCQREGRWLAVIVGIAAVAGCASHGKLSFAGGGMSAAAGPAVESGALATAATFDASAADPRAASGGAEVAVGGDGLAGGASTADAGNGTPGGTPSGTGEGGSAIASPTGVILDHVGKTVSGVGHSMGAIDTDTAGGSVLSHMGTTVSSAGQAVSGGVGKLGTSDDAIGETLAGLPLVVDHAGETVSSAGQLVQATGRAMPSAPITSAAGRAIDKTGIGVRGLTSALSKLTQETGVRRVTATSTRAVVPIEHDLTSLTQRVGDGVGIGSPVASLTQQLGNGIAGTPPIPLTAPLGSTVSSLGGLVHASQTGTSAGGAMPAGGLAIGAAAGLGAGVALQASPGALGIAGGAAAGAAAGIATGSVLASPLSAGPSSIATPVAVLAPITAIAAPLADAAAPITGPLVSASSSANSVTPGTLGGVLIGASSGTFGLLGTR